MGAWAIASLFLVSALWMQAEAKTQLFQMFKDGNPAALHSASSPGLQSRLDLGDSDPLDDAFLVYSNFEDRFQGPQDGYQEEQMEANDRYGAGNGVVGYRNYGAQPRQYHHEEQEKHGEVHYHKHEHIHDHKHKQVHDHKHKQDHQHKHMHQQKHEHGHHSEHKHGHKHEHGHHQDHKHDHHHGHDHKHDHHNDHKHDHHHGHKHHHKNEHKHGHKHGHKEEHKHGHKHNHHQSKHH